MDNDYLINIKNSTSCCDWVRLYKILDQKAQNSKKMKYSKEKLDEYKIKIESKNYESLLNRKINNENDLVTAMCIAYSWMPTMLEIHGTKEDIEQVTLQLISLDSVKWYCPNEKAIIFNLSKIVNHSIVGAIKTLHLIDPNRFPLIDSRVLTAWNKLMVNIQDTCTIESLGGTFNLGHDMKNLNKLIEKYFYYRAFIIHWKSNLDKDIKIRDIEFRLYLMGDKL